MARCPTRFMSRALLLSAVAMLPACKPFEWGKGKGGCSCPHEAEEELKLEGIEPSALRETVVSIEGKPAVTGEDYERSFQIILENQPALKDMLPYIPEEQKDQMFGQLLEGMAMEKLMQRWVKDSGIENQPEYRRNAKRVHEAVDRDLALRAFENELLKEIKISDEEARRYYLENRTTDPMFQRPPFLIAPGGVKAKAIEVSNEKEARDLADKARKSSLAAAAKEIKKQVTDYGLVNPHSFIDADVKSKILETTNFPSIEVIKGSDGKYRVVEVISKQEPKYAEPDAHVIEAAKQVLTSKRYSELSAQRLAELKDKYKLEVHKDYIQKRKKKAPETGAQASAGAQEAELGQAPGEKEPTAGVPRAGASSQVPTQAA
jgi:hypothetical protein